MKRIFIASSAKTPSHPFLVELIREIERHGFDVVAPSAVYAETDLPLIENIRKCGFVLGVIIGNDSNVYFEIGFAMGARKPVLLVSSPTVILPFDLRSVNCIMADTLSEETVSRIVEHLKSQRFDEGMAYTVGRSFKDVLKLYRDDPREFEAIDSEEFDRCIKEWFAFKGMQVVENAGAKDAGFDLGVNGYEGHRTTLVEVRKQSGSSKVSVVQVRALLGVVYAESADHGIFISASDFTKSAYEFAERCEPKIELWTVDRLVDQLE
jgi:hypothetical protein